MQELLGYLSKQELGNVVVSGGEPTMHPVKRHENLTVLMSIYEDESLDDKFQQLYDSVNETYLQTFVNHKDYNRTHGFCEKYGIKEFKSSWNDDPDTLFSMYEPCGNFGWFVTPKGTVLTCDYEQYVYDAISELARMEAVRSRKQFGHMVHECRCYSGTKYNYIFNKLCQNSGIKFQQSSDV